MARTRIKICGITDVQSAEAAVEAGADAIGLVFAKGSPRRIDFDTAIEITDVLPPFVTAVGVFQLANAADAELDEWWGEWVQLHGSEDEALVEKIAESHKVIRGFRFSKESIMQWNRCSCIEAMLIDGSAGGGGETFDHAQLARLTGRLDVPIILAGGLTPENVGDAIRTVRPFAVDVSSSVEKEPGVKDPNRIRAFCKAVRQADAE